MDDQMEYIYFKWNANMKNLYSKIFFILVKVVTF